MNNKFKNEKLESVNLKEFKEFKLAFNIHTKEIINVIEGKEMKSAFAIARELRGAGINFSSNDIRKGRKLGKLLRASGRKLTNEKLENYTQFLFDLGNTPYLLPQLDREIKGRLQFILPSMNDEEKAGALTITGVFLSSKAIIEESNRELQKMGAGFGGLSPQYTKVWRADLGGALGGALKGALIGGAAGALGWGIFDAALASGLAILDKNGGDTSETR